MSFEATFQSLKFNSIFIWMHDECVPALREGHCTLMHSKQVLDVSGSACVLCRTLWSQFDLLCLKVNDLF